MFRQERSMSLLTSCVLWLQPTDAPMLHARSSVNTKVTKALRDHYFFDKNDKTIAPATPTRHQRTLRTKLCPHTQLPLWGRVLDKVIFSKKKTLGPNDKDYAEEIARLMLEGTEIEEEEVSQMMADMVKGGDWGGDMPDVDGVGNKDAVRDGVGQA